MITQDDIDRAVLAGRITPEIREAQHAAASKRRKAWEAAQLAAFADHVYAASEPVIVAEPNSQLAKYIKESFPGQAVVSPVDPAVDCDRLRQSSNEPDHDIIEDARTNARLDAAADCDDSANWSGRVEGESLAERNQ